MLGLANALSGTATIVDRKYSAYFDGTGDYIDTGDTFQATLRADFSWSLWVKPDDGQPGSTDALLGAVNSSGEDKFQIFIGDSTGSDGGKIIIQHESNNDDATVKTDNAVFPNGACDWTHIAVRVQYTDGGADTSYNIYVNGYAVNATTTNAVSEANHELYTSDINFYIGGNNNNGSLSAPFTGYIDEVALFRSHLSGVEIAAIYNSGRPFDLINDLGDYDQASNLKAYWKMFDGLFDDRVNGIVHDNGISSGAPGYGSELWDGTDGDDANWALNLSGNNTKAEVDGSVQFTYVDNTTGGYIYLNDSKDLSTDLTVGAIYKCTFETKTNTGTNNWHINDGATSGSVNYTSGNVTTEWQTKNIYFSAAHTQNAYLMLTNMGSGEVTLIKNISLKKLNGFPGIASGNTTFNTSTPHTQAMSSVATFDGIGDYLALDNILDFGDDDFSVSAWIKASDLTNFPIISKFEDANNVWRLVADGDDKLNWLAKADGNETGAKIGGTALTALQDSWIHTCISGDRDGNITVYVNGSTSTYGVSAASMSNSGQNLDNDGSLYIGRYDSQYATGWIDEVAIWNVALDADAVAAVHGNIWDGTSGDDANWTVYGSNTKAENDSAVKITNVDNNNGGYIFLRDAFDLDTNLIIGNRYKLTAKTKVDSGSVTWTVRSKDSSGWTEYDAATITSTSYADIVIYFVADSTTEAILYSDDLSSSTWIKEISLIDLSARKNRNLTANFGNYDNSSSLQGYWRMNLETKGSIVYTGHPDVIHSTPGGTRGENLISNGDFETAGASETDATGWTPTAIAAHNERSSEYAFKGTYSWKYSSGGQITVNGATSGSTTAVFDDVTGAVAGMYLRTVSSGSLSGTSAHNEITNVNTDTKTLTFAGAQTLANDATVTFGMTNHGVQHDISGGVEAGKTYELSYWCYTVNPGGGSTTYAANNWINVSAGTIANIASGNNYGGAGSGSGYGNWFKVTNYYHCHTTDTSATIRLGNGGAAQPTTYYFDDVQFKEVTGNPAIPVANATIIRQPV